MKEAPITRKKMIRLLNEDLAREYQAVIAYVVYSQTIKGAAYGHIARELEKGPPLAFANIKRAVYGNWGELEDALRREREGQLQLLRSQDAIEGIMAWAQKREPTFEGK